MSPGDPTVEDRVASVLRASPDVVVAYLFGSRAGGRPRRDSDIDIAVIFRGSLGRKERFGLRCELGGSIAAAGGAEFADVIDLEEAPPLLAHAILRTARLLFSRDERRRVEVTARQVMRYIDSRPARRVLDEATFRRLREGSFGRLA